MFKNLLEPSTAIFLLVCHLQRKPPRSTQKGKSVKKEPPPTPRGGSFLALLGLSNQQNSTEFLNTICQSHFLGGYPRVNFSSHSHFPRYSSGTRLKQERGFHASQRGFGEWSRCGEINSDLPIYGDIILPAVCTAGHMFMRRHRVKKRWQVQAMHTQKSWAIVSNREQSWAIVSNREQSWAYRKWT